MYSSIQSTRCRYQDRSAAGRPMNSAITSAGTGYAKSATKSTSWPSAPTSAM